MSIAVASRPQIKERAQSWLFALPAASLSAALGLYQLAEPSIWYDEAATLRNTAGTYSALTSEMHWLYYTVVKPWFEFAGTSEAAIRLPSVLGAVVAVTLLYGFADKLFGRRVAVVSSVLLAVNPFVVQWSQQARGYSILLALGIGATWLLVRALERDSYAAWVLYGVVLLVLVHWQTLAAFFFLPVHAVVAWRSRTALASIGLVAVSSIPWLWNLMSRPADQLPTIWIRDPTVSYVGLTLLEVGGAFGVGVALAAIGVLLVREHRRLLVVWALLPFAVALVASLHDPVFVDRYLIVCSPAFAMLGAVALVRLAGKARVVATGATAAAAAVGLFLWYAPDGSRNWAGEDWRAATAFAMNRGGAEVFGSNPRTAYVYYGGRFARTGLVIERRSRHGFAENSHVVAQFGRKVRVVRKPVRDG
jgi:mannosyltransferase